MSAIDALLARARLHDGPGAPADTVPYEDSAYPEQAYDTVAPVGEPPADAAADRHLRTLCDLVLTALAPGTLRFLTDQLPEPEGAWRLGCALSVAGIEEGARFWWQYAAGAGHTPAAYCLSLHHRARGEAHAAAHWYDQTGLDALTDHDTVPVTGLCPPVLCTFDASVPTVLRILSRLAPADPRPRPHRADAVTNYVALAVQRGYARHPGVEIPVPGPRFADRVSFLLTWTPPWSGTGTGVFNPALPSRAGEASPRGPRGRGTAAREPQGDPVKWVISVRASR
ncbi:hypothetical protein QQY24_09810 [Streptomyces sp. TG1A-8]|uniref:hypothetical protein n=1 Tax=Streptomyces sp. TG1A-8 TaxID=3051385 RepID=UPI00265BB48D|nr:hypothetical protein [Streptomyces sp. TG1A-8]MDO0925693.1 hypothetical protein [Streptomyces sp. TG1A-8]